MKQLDIRFETLPAYHVACFSGFGAEPEMEAWGKLVVWANEKKIFPLKPGVRIFGFNNPDPAPGSPNYGYDFWITIDPSMDEPGLKTLDFPGGEYAVVHCDGVEVIVQTWQALNQWIEQSEYVYGKYQWLEEVFLKNNNPDDFDHFDLFMPIQKG